MAIQSMTIQQFLRVLPSLFYFASHTAPAVHNTGCPSSTDPDRSGAGSRPVKSRSYRHSGQTAFAAVIVSAISVVV